VLLGWAVASQREVPQGRCEAPAFNGTDAGSVGGRAGLLLDSWTAPPLGAAAGGGGVSPTHLACCWFSSGRPIRSVLASRLDPPASASLHQSRAHASRPDCGAASGWMSEPAVVELWVPHRLGSPRKRTPWLSREALSCRWGPGHRRSLSISRTHRSTKALLNRYMVGATGFEPVTSSVSANCREPLCGRPFSQVAVNR
jgi:hypothetical protein